MSVKAINAKQTLVHEISENLKKAKSFVVFEYLGLTASEITSLRFALNKSNSKLQVLKNNILARAIKEANIDGFEGSFVGPNAIAIAFEDEISPIKEISKIAKNCECVKIKGAYLENNFLDAQKVQEIANIPGREGLYSMFLSCLQSPVRSFLYALKAVSETKN
ncbi:MAG: 50S ribosomal protein L10 [Ureaplasma sp.]|nr:50S ribosomal protein L10 [Ureaplasma sp.]